MVMHAYNNVVITCVADITHVETRIKQHTEIEKQKRFGHGLCSLIITQINNLLIWNNQIWSAHNVLFIVAFRLKEKDALPFCAFENT